MQQIAQQPIVLIAEADSLIGLDLCDALQTAGYRVLGPFAMTNEALVALRQDSPTLAVIDTALREGSSTTLADALRYHGVPFLVHSAHQPEKIRPVSFQGTPWLVKPAPPWDVVTLCDELSLSSPAPENREPDLSIQF